MPNYYLDCHTTEFLGSCAWRPKKVSHNAQSELVRDLKKSYAGDFRRKVKPLFSTPSSLISSNFWPNYSEFNTSVVFHFPDKGFVVPLLYCCPSSSKWVLFWRSRSMLRRLSWSRYRSRSMFCKSKERDTVRRRKDVGGRTIRIHSVEENYFSQLPLVSVAKWVFEPNHLYDNVFPYRFVFIQKSKTVGNHFRLQ